MAILAQLHEADASERRGAARRRLQLETHGATQAAAQIRVVIHDLSVSGLLIETIAQFSVGERLQVQLPQAGAAEALIVWNSGRFFGCRFVQPISTAAVSAALLLSPGHSPAADNAELVSIALGELRALATRVEHITDKLDKAIEESGEAEHGEPAEPSADEARPSDSAPPAMRLPRRAAWVAALAVWFALLIFAAVAWRVWGVGQTPY
jgi:hypothetical protein